MEVKRLNEKEEYVEVTVKVPKNIMALLKNCEKHLGHTATEMLEEAVISGIGDRLHTGEFAMTPDQIAAEYGLESLLEKY